MEELKNFKVKRIVPETLPSKGLSEYPLLEEQLEHAEKVLVGIGQEWHVKRVIERLGDVWDNDRKSRIMEAYEELYQMIKDKDYFIVTTNTDALIFESPLDSSRITAPCGNGTWRQCSEACTKDIWEPGEIPDDMCPHCGAPMTGNTIDAKIYIEEGYLPQWRLYTGWLASTRNRRVLVLELGEGFKVPTVIRWPFEKTVRYNQKSFFYRVNERFAQLAEGTQERAVSVKGDSVEWVRRNHYRKNHYNETNATTGNETTGNEITGNETTGNEITSNETTAI